MKKINLILIFIFIIMSFSVSGSIMYERYGLQYYGGSSIADSYLLNSASAFTSDINHTNWDKCNAGAGGYDFGVYPTQFTLNNYVYAGALVPYSNSIRLIGGNCTEIDNFAVGGIIKTGIVQISFYGGSPVTQPFYGVVYEKTTDSKYYLMVMQLNNETSELEQLEDIYIADDMNVVGFAGGCTNARNGVCSPFYRVFGILDSLNNKLYVTDYSNDWNVVNTSIGYISQEDHFSQMVYDDMDADGTMEFAWAGGGYYSTGGYSSEAYIYHSRFAYDDGTQTFTAEVNHTKVIIVANMGDTSTGSQGGTDYVPNMHTCQVGARASALEWCVYVGALTDQSGWTRQSNYAIVTHDSTVLKGVTLNGGNHYGIIPVTFDVDADDDIDVCIPTSTSTLSCYDRADFTNAVREWTNLPVMATTPANMKTVFMVDIDNDDTTIEILFGDGTLYHLLDNESTVQGTDWDSTISSTGHGYFSASDISNDGQTELLYIDSSIFRIYSESLTDVELMNYTSESETPPTPPAEPYAYDLDGGLNYNEANYTYNGTTYSTGDVNDSIAYDYCDNTNTDVLNEFYITGTAILENSVNCVSLGYYGCIIGQCANEEKYIHIIEGIQNGSIIPPLSGWIGEEQDTPIITPTIEESNLPVVLNKLQDNIQLIFALFIIVGVVLITASKSKNPLVLMFAGIIATIIMTIIGFIPVVVVILIIVSLILLLFLGMTVFKQEN